jgi:hypothetical protein
MMATELIVALVCCIAGVGVITTLTQSPDRINPRVEGWLIVVAVILLAALVDALEKAK